MAGSALEPGVVELGVVVGGFLGSVLGVVALASDGLEPRIDFVSEPGPVPPSMPTPLGGFFAAPPSDVPALWESFGGVEVVLVPSSPERLSLPLPNALFGAAPFATASVGEVA